MKEETKMKMKKKVKKKCLYDANIWNVIVSVVGCWWYWYTDD